MALLSGCVQVSGKSKYEISGSTPSVSAQEVSGEYAFSAPPEAASITICVMEYQDSEWHPSFELPMNIGKESISSGPLSGTLSISVSQDSSISLQMDCCGKEYSWAISKSENDTAGLNSAYSFLEDPQAISLNEPIPLAIFAYGERAVVDPFTTDIYNTPEALGKWEFLRATTITFQDTTDTKSGE